MTYRHTNLGMDILLVALLAGGFCPSRVLAQGVQSSKRDFSSPETNAVEIFKSLNQLENKDEGFKQLQEELKKSSLRSISHQAYDQSGPVGSAPLPLPAMQTRRKN